MSEAAIAIPSVTLASRVANVYKTGAFSYTANYTVTSVNETQGVVALNIVVYDLASNIYVQTVVNDTSYVIIDTVIPTFPVVQMQTTNRVNQSMATIGDVITISFNVSELALFLPTAEMASKSVPVYPVDVNMYVTNYTVVANDIQGLLQYWIAVYDYARNLGNVTDSSTDGSYAIIDTINHVIFNVSMICNNKNPKIAKTGDVITITFVSSEELYVYQTTIVGNSATVTTSDFITYTTVYNPKD